MSTLTYSIRPVADSSGSATPADGNWTSGGSGDIDFQANPGGNTTDGVGSNRREDFTITWTATDAAGNSSSATSTVQLTDTCGPVFGENFAAAQALGSTNYKYLDETYTLVDTWSITINVPIPYGDDTTSGADGGGTTIGTYIFDNFTGVDTDEWSWTVGLSEDDSDSSKENASDANGDGDAGYVDAAQSTSQTKIFDATHTLTFTLLDDTNGGSPNGAGFYLEEFYVFFECKDRAGNDSVNKAYAKYTIRRQAYEIWGDDWGIFHNKEGETTNYTSLGQRFSNTGEYNSGELVSTPKVDPTVEVFPWSDKIISDASGVLNCFGVWNDSTGVYSLGTPPWNEATILTMVKGINMSTWNTGYIYDKSSATAALEDPQQSDQTYGRLIWLIGSDESDGQDPDQFHFGLYYSSNLDEGIGGLKAVVHYYNDNTNSSNGTMEFNFQLFEGGVMSPDEGDNYFAGGETPDDWMFALSWTISGSKLEFHLSVYYRLTGGEWFALPKNNKSFGANANGGYLDTIDTVTYDDVTANSVWDNSGPWGDEPRTYQGNQMELQGMIVGGHTNGGDSSNSNYGLNNRDRQLSGLHASEIKVVMIEGFTNTYYT
tara:strand:- start:1488 stop:3290 length:1803 start_codon:yes stop_codon:yes gene_type:complete